MCLTRYVCQTFAKLKKNILIDYEFCKFCCLAGLRFVVANLFRIKHDASRHQAHAQASQAEEKQHRQPHRMVVQAAPEQEVSPEEAERRYRHRQQHRLGGQAARIDSVPKESRET